MKAKDLTVGETYLVSRGNDWQEYASQIERKVLLSADPFVYDNAGYGFASLTVDTVAVRTLATDDAVVEKYGDVQTVNSGYIRPSRDGAWKLPYSSSHDYVGVLMVKVDKNGNPEGPAHVVALRSVRDTYEHGTGIIRANQRARAKAQRERAERENDRLARFTAARDSVQPQSTYDITMYDGPVRMSLEEFERIAALAARALAVDS